MVKYGTSHGDWLVAHQNDSSVDSALNSTYYDAEQVYLQISDYLKAKGDSRWQSFLSYASAAQHIYADRYVIPNNGNVPGYWNFTTGLRLQAQKTGDTVAKSTAILLSKNAAYTGDGTELDWTTNYDRSREVAYVILSYIDSELLGEAPRARRIIMVNQAYGHLDQWFTKFSWQTSGGNLQPFMVGLTCYALIEDWRTTSDARLIPALRKAADWLWANAWVASGEGMWYEWDWGQPKPTSAAPDLNQLIAVTYAFLYHQTGETQYRDQGDALFAGGVKHAFLDGAKQFDQSYRWSFDYVTWRSMTPVKA